MGELAPSILSADFSCLKDQLELLEQSGIEMIHIDVMDGKFVPNISLGFPVIKSIKTCTKMMFDVHLMVEEPSLFVEETVKSGADIITIHAEACTHLSRVIQQIKNFGCRVGVAINPATPLHILEYVLKDIDTILLMTVNPGFGGQCFIPEMKQKIKDCKHFCHSRGYRPIIQLDGGITLDNAKDLLELGADILVAGSAVFNGDIKANVVNFQKILKVGDMDVRRIKGKSL